MTPKQQRFVEEYLLDLNASAAARRAGYTGDANTVGPRLLANVGVSAAIAAAQEKRAQRTQIDADWVLRTLAAEKTADLADIYDGNGNLRPISEWPMVWRTGLVVGVEAFEEYQGHGESREAVGMVRKVKISDRIKHIELIGRHVNVAAFRDKVELDIPAGVQIYLPANGR